ncbi:MAG TPA: bifunctional glycosyltransferase/class I SAM-dependent methyltransferase [Polyangia bacterium]|jgi:glycosyltransferase involved in cell wall biosynthesis|nr:bifunctional glycosyltransferase/class I SAM-dependent methyltransferase [Polyangia bacterium]
MAADGKPRLLVFVIAYYADTTLKRVLERIPSSIFTEYDCEVLVVDDASADRTFEIGRAYEAAHPEMRITVLRNQFNQGYGGNQKVGYAFAIEEKFDFVAMLHGDGQYAPEVLPFLLEPLRDGQADAVFGSRMMRRFGALEGGMPLYKYLGNKVLTRLQNAMLGTRLSEFHSGYRIYSVKTLASIPFRLNANDFHFDTEIIVQLLNAGARIVERPIPTYYGDEICRVNGMKYAKDVIAATWANVLHRSGIFYQRRYDTEPTGNAHYDLKLGFTSSHTMALDAVPAGAKVLDIGAGPGGMARELANKGCQAAVVDQLAPTEPTGGIDVLVQDLDEELRFSVGEYDYLLLLDVIEHLRAPEQFLARLRAQFDYRPKTLVLTTPNVAFIIPRLMLLAGEFNYGKSGILDLTHTRLFTFRSAEQLLRDAGFRIKRVRGVPAPFPKALGNGVLGKAALVANEALLRVSKTLFAYQIFIEAESTPDVDFILRDTKQQSHKNAPKIGWRRSS